LRASVAVAAAAAASAGSDFQCSLLY